MSLLCTICARGGSKGVPGKNIRPLLDKPLIAYSIEQARATGLFDCIAVSSDSEEILGVAKEYDVDCLIKRPDELASDGAGKLPAIAHAVRQAEVQSARRYDLVVDLDATSPLRLPQDIAGAIALQRTTSATNIITGAPAHRSPYFNLVEMNADGSVRLSKASNVLRRQDSPACYDMNASIYVWRRDALLAEPKVFYDDTRLYEMPRERSFDIDEPLDFAIVELILTQRGSR